MLKAWCRRWQLHTYLPLTLSVEEQGLCRQVMDLLEPQLSWARQDGHDPAALRLEACSGEWGAWYLAGLLMTLLEAMASTSISHRREHTLILAALRQLAPNPAEGSACWRMAQRLARGSNPWNGVVVGRRCGQLDARAWLQRQLPPCRLALQLRGYLDSFGEVRSDTPDHWLGRLTPPAIEFAPPLEKTA